MYFYLPSLKKCSSMIDDMRNTFNHVVMITMQTEYIQKQIPGTGPLHMMKIWAIRNTLINCDQCFELRSLERFYSCILIHTWMQKVIRKKSYWVILSKPHYHFIFNCTAWSDFAENMSSPTHCVFITIMQNIWAVYPLRVLYCLRWNIAEYMLTRACVRNECSGQGHWVMWPCDFEVDLGNRSSATNPNSNGYKSRDL